MKNRSSGILMHISSLPGPYGIGDMGKEAYLFVDFLSEAKQKNWQILPLGMTGYGDSPYQSFSAFAGNPYFIDLRELVSEGFLDPIEVENTNFGNNPTKIDYGLLFISKMDLLRKAYLNAKETLHEKLNQFFQEHEDWLMPFALFMSIKSLHQNKSWNQWEEKYQQYDSPEVHEYRKKNLEEIYFWVFCQYYFWNQWQRLKNYANKKSIKIIGDLPIYVAEDSADVWANGHLFHLDSQKTPITVAGCPPDLFSSTGQLWGNPIYNWDSMAKNNYNWWIKRIDHSFKLFNSLRIDHFRGFEAYWAIPHGAKDAVGGEWIKGPGQALFHAIKEALGELDIIAEDLGFMTDGVKDLIKDLGFPGMKVLQFAFDSREENDYIPHNYDKNSIVYTGTHDNETTSGWLQSIPSEDFMYAVHYLKLNYDEGLVWGFIRGAWSSTANLAIAPMQDFLELDNHSRMNTPSTLGCNWTWRMEQEAITQQLTIRIAELTLLYGR